MQTGYDLEKEESDIRRSRIGKITLSQMRFKIGNGKLILLPLKEPPRARQQTQNVEDENIPTPFSSNNILQNEQEMVRM